LHQSRLGLTGHFGGGFAGQRDAATRRHRIAVRRKFVFALNLLLDEDVVLFKLPPQNCDLSLDFSPLAIRFTRASIYFLPAKAPARLFLGFLCEPG
jgi:hypothetical protein